LCSTESGCRYGANCRFLHSSGDAPPVAGKVVDGADKCAAGKTSDTAVDGVETAMAGLSVVDESCSSALTHPVAADDSSQGATACLSSDSLASASGATKCSRKKKKTAKKGAKKSKPLSKCKELVLYDHQTVKCGASVFHYISVFF